MAIKRILVINTIGLSYEGITTVIYNYISKMNKENLEIHFAAKKNIGEDLKQRFSCLGTLDYVSDRKGNVFSYIKDLNRLLRSHFDVIHIHGNSGTMLIEVLLAKLHGVKNIMIHGHSTKTDHPLLNQILKMPMIYLADTCMACSKAAGDWLYGKYPYTILNNAIDLAKFQYDEELRAKYRKEVGAEEFLIGHIGHFTPQKNHFFLIDIFFEFHKMVSCSKLLLVSDGPQFEQVKEKVAALGLQDAVIFAGRRNDIAGMYSAMDMFILPSNWEGLPLVMLEAQANGLPLLVSDVITREAQCTERVFYKPLSDGAHRWAEHIQRIKDACYDRHADTQADIAKHGFDIEQEAEALRKLYLKKINISRDRSVHMRIVEDFRGFTSGGDFWKKSSTILLNPCFHSVCLFRLSSWFYQKHCTILAKIIWYMNRVFFHVDIDYRADLAGGFVLIHGLGTVIGCEVCSKGKLRVYQGVTIGGNNGNTRVDETGKMRGQALIGNDVTIYTDACIFGPVIISDYAVIKAKQLVTKDI